MRTDPRFQKWCRWVDIISLDVQDLYVDRDIFTSVMEIVQKNDQIDKRSP